MPVPLKVVLLIATLIYIFIVLRALKHKRMQISLSLLWLLTGLFLIVGLLAPNFVKFIANSLGFQVTANMVFCIAIFLAFYLVFNLNLLLAKESKSSTLLVQEISLLKKEVEELKNKKE